MAPKKNASMKSGGSRPHLQPQPQTTDINTPLSTHSRLPTTLALSPPHLQNIWPSSDETRSRSGSSSKPPPSPTTHLKKRKKYEAEQEPSADMPYFHPVPGHDSQLSNAPPLEDANMDLDAEEDEDEDEDDFQVTTPGKKGRAPSHNNFPNKLFRLVSDPHFNSYIHWDDEGLGFVMPCQDRFTGHILARGTIFKTKHFSSFIRQLNNYDFHKVTKTGAKTTKSGEPQVVHFKHANDWFQQDRLDLISLIERKVADKVASHKYASTPGPAANRRPANLSALPAHLASIDNITSQSTPELFKLIAVLTKRLGEMEQTVHIQGNMLQLLWGMQNFALPSQAMPFQPSAMPPTVVMAQGNVLDDNLTPKARSLAVPPDTGTPSAWATNDQTSEMSFSPYTAPTSSPQQHYHSAFVQQGGPIPPATYAPLGTTFPQQTHTPWPQMAASSAIDPWTPTPTNTTMMSSNPSELQFSSAPRLVNDYKPGTDPHNSGGGSTHTPASHVSRNPVQPLSAVGPFINSMNVLPPLPPPGKGR